MWNWQQKQWPNFHFEKEALIDLEYQFYENNGMVVGVLKHISDAKKDNLLIDVLSNEAMKTSAIEGEFLNRNSIQSSIRKNLGLTTDARKVPPAEYGIAEMMVDLYKHYNKKLSHEQLYAWHKMISNGRRDLNNIGSYRTHSEAMQVVSGRLDKPQVHFEAPPSKQVWAEMQQFIAWFNAIHSNNDFKLMPLTKAGIAHLYFVSIHPFEDGNGRIARALAEKSIALSTQKPTLISLSQMIDTNKKAYYFGLETNNKCLEITNWLIYFAQTILAAQQDTLQRIEFIIEKTKFFDQFAEQLNPRQMKVIQKVFDAGHNGFIGGLNASKYKRIAKTSASTATRDLNNLVEKNILIKIGELKSTRYSLNLKT